MFDNDLIFEQRPGQPEELGFFNIYIRERNSGAYRPNLQRVRFPVARYSRDRFRMYSLNLSVFHYTAI
jgi:hypothetical protein